MTWVLVSREFGERLRPGAESLSPRSISKPCMFCTGYQDICEEPQSPRGMWLALPGGSDSTSLMVPVTVTNDPHLTFHLQPHSWFGVGLRLNPGGLTPESGLLTSLGILDGGCEGTPGLGCGWQDEKSFAKQKSVVCVHRQGYILGKSEEV